jgi:hypothetical protein
VDRWPRTACRQLAIQYLRAAVITVCGYIYIKENIWDSKCHYNTNHCQKVSLQVMFAIQQGCQCGNYNLFVNGSGGYVIPEGLSIPENWCILMMLACWMPCAVFRTLWLTINSRAKAVSFCVGLLLAYLSFVLHAIQWVKYYLQIIHKVPFYFKPCWYICKCVACDGCASKLWAWFRCAVSHVQCLLWEFHHVACQTIKLLYLDVFPTCPQQMDKDK